MPKSKRDKKVSLTKTDKKGVVLKQRIVEDIRSCVQKYNDIFLFSVQNMRNAKLKDLRNEWKDSRFFFGKNKIMALGLGKNKEQEVEDDLHKLSSKLQGQCGLLFTNRAKNEVIDSFKNFSAEDFARSGFVAKETITLSEGPLDQFPHSIEPHLRSLGLPTSLQRGVVTLLQDYEVCRSGAALTPEQARILKLLGKTIAEFKLTIKCCWSKENGFENIMQEVDSGHEEMEEDSD